MRYPRLASLELHHSSCPSLVDDSVTTLLASDGVALTERKRTCALSTVIFDAQRLVNDVAVRSVRDRRGDGEPFSLGRGHFGVGAVGQRAGELQMHDGGRKILTPRYMQEELATDDLGYRRTLVNAA